VRVELSKILPNPYRNLPEYPIDPAKIERLKASIEKTGFWDNVVGRKRKDGKVEIAYGHHRMEALRNVRPKIQDVGIIIRDLDDGTMIQIMAAENDEVYSLGPGVINETVKAARDYLRAHPEVVRPGPHTRKDDRHGEALGICAFLSWPQGRVEEALAQLAMFEKPVEKGTVKIEKAVLESLPTQKAAEEFRRAIVRGNVNPIHHKTLAKKIIDGKIGKRQIAAEIEKSAYSTRKNDPVGLGEQLRGVTAAAGKLERELQGIQRSLSYLTGGSLDPKHKDDYRLMVGQLKAVYYIIPKFIGGVHASNRTVSQSRKLLSR